MLTFHFLLSVYTVRVKKKKRKPEFDLKYLKIDKRCNNLISVGDSIVILLSFDTMTVANVN